MVGDREGGHLELECARDELIDPVGAVEEGVLGVGVKMNEGQGFRCLVSGFRAGGRELQGAGEEPGVYIIPARARGVYVVRGGFPNKHVIQ
jgi:hypothetical protein